MHIFVGKIGKSILFNPNSWGSTGGDNEAPKYYENLFHRNPNDTFYLIGATDFGRLPLNDRLRINKHNNVVNAWDGFKTWKLQNPDVIDEETNRIYLKEWYDALGVTFDTGVLFAGPTGTSNVCGKTTLMKSPDVIAKPLEMLARYSGPIISFLNDTKIPYALIVNDPRYFPSNSKDWFHRPSIVLSQYEEVAITKSKLDYRSGETYEVPIKTQYAAMETIFLIGLERGGSAANKEPVNTLDAFFDDAKEIEEDVKDVKDVNFLVVLNEGRPSRYKSLKESILDHIDDVDIYGKWDPDTIKDDKRFKGSVGFHDLQRMLPRVKYTYCIPIKKGWVTSKFWEMAHYGIIPFMHPTYDEQNHLGAPSILKANSKELFEAINVFNNSEKAYNAMRDILDKMLKDEFYSGKYLSDLTMKALKEIT